MSFWRWTGCQTSTSATLQLPSKKALEQHFTNLKSPNIASCATSDNSRRKTINDIFDEKVNEIIDAKKQQTKEALKEIEKTFRAGIEGHIAYHKILMESARERGDLSALMRYQVMVETYESILRNYSLSSSYG